MVELKPHTWELTAELAATLTRTMDAETRLRLLNRWVAVLLPHAVFECTKFTVEE